MPPARPVSLGVSTLPSRNATSAATPATIAVCANVPNCANAGEVMPTTAAIGPTYGHDVEHAGDDAPHDRLASGRAPPCAAQVATATMRLISARASRYRRI